MDRGGEIASEREAQAVSLRKSMSGASVEYIKIRNLSPYSGSWSTRI
jgi:hypothetical protein